MALPSFTGPFPPPAHPPARLEVDPADRSPPRPEQGATLSKGYRDFCKNKAPCNFQVFFGNPGAAAHCVPGKAGQCNNDPAQQCTGSINIIERRQHEWELAAPSLARRTLYTNGTYVPGPVQFRTAGGQLLDAPYGGTVGQAVHAPRALNQTLHEELLARHAAADHDDDDEDDQFDELAANMVSDVDYLQEVVWEARLKE